MPNAISRRHVFYAQASSLIAVQEGGPPIPEQAPLQLSAYGGNQNSPPNAGFDRLGFVTFANGYTTVSGIANANGWSTVVTSVVEGLSIGGGVLKAEKVISKTTTQYPLVGYVPSINFAGTDFVNLTVNGVPVNPTFNLNMCSPQPANDAPYVTDPGFLGRAQAEYTKIFNSKAPADIKNQFVWNPGAIQRSGRVNCSLVTGTALPDTQSFGHVLDIANLGYVYLAELAVSNHIEVTMIRVEHKLLGQSESRTVNTDAQGHTMP